ncbi:Myb-like DNA-binding domain-containing protein [Microdochium nivale]|nr:Myb-like DNA-binding domain-containing protein [Microdochium nivale]
MNMPKHTRSSSQAHNRFTASMPVSLAPSAPLPIYSSSRVAMPVSTSAYYPAMPSTTTAQPALTADDYDSYAAALPVSQPPMPHRASSGAWTPLDDQNLLGARQQGLNWSQIHLNYFPNKSPNACRKRHERLMERKGADDWDQRRLEQLAKEYMSMRKEIWQGLAAKTGERWNVVEQMCMTNGLKNLQSASRSASRRERLESGQTGIHGYDDDDSGISGIGLTPIDDLDLSYSSPAASSHSSGSHGGSSSVSSLGGHPHSNSAYGMALAHQHHSQMSMNPYGGGGHSHQHHHHAYSGSTGAMSSSYGSTHSSNPAITYSTHDGASYQLPSTQQQRLPSVDMGIESIINRPSHRGHGAHHHHGGI